MINKEEKVRPETAVQLREKENNRVALGIVAWQEKRARRKFNNKTIPEEYLEGNSNPSQSNDSENAQSINNQFVHEDELHSIISKFNKVMDKLTTNVEKNKVVLNELHEDHQENSKNIKKVTSKVNEIQLKNDHFINKQQYFENFFVTADEGVLENTLPGYDNKNRKESIFDFNEPGNDSHEIPDDENVKNNVINPQDLSKEELYNFLKEKLEKFNNKKAEVDFRLRKNKELNEKLNTYLKSEYSIKTCNFCKQQYSPFCNTQTSCTYHLGKLRYEQCRGCGTDEYYTCCLKCNKCSPGCRTGPHSPIN